MPFHGSISHFFLMLNVIPLSVCNSIFIPSLTEGYLDCFQDWQWWIKLQLISTCSFCVYTIFNTFGLIPRNTNSESYGKGMFNFIGNPPNCHPKWPYHFTFSQQSMRLSIFQYPRQFSLFYFFVCLFVLVYCHPSGCVKYISLWFWFAFA